MNIWKLLYRLEGSPSHCDKCGRILLATRTPVKFNKHTGEPTKIKVKVKCSNPEPEFESLHYNTSWIERLMQEDIPLLVETPQYVKEAI